MELMRPSVQASVMATTNGDPFILGPQEDKKSSLSLSSSSLRSSCSKGRRRPMGLSAWNAEESGVLPRQLGVNLLGPDPLIALKLLLISISWHEDGVTGEEDCGIGVLNGDVPHIDGRLLMS